MMKQYLCMKLFFLFFSSFFIISCFNNPMDIETCMAREVLISSTQDSYCTLYGEYIDTNNFFCDRMDSCIIYVDTQPILAYINEPVQLNLVTCTYNISFIDSNIANINISLLKKNDSSWEQIDFFNNYFPVIFSELYFPRSSFPNWITSYEIIITFFDAGEYKVLYKIKKTNVIIEKNIIIENKKLWYF